MKETKNGWKALRRTVPVTPRPASGWEQKPLPTHSVMVWGTVLLTTSSPLLLKKINKKLKTKTKKKYIYILVLVRSIGGSSYCSYRRQRGALEPPLQLAEFGENVNKATSSIIRHVFCLAYVFPTWDPIEIAR